MYQDLSQFITDIRSNWKHVARYYQFARNKFFYSEEFISILLFNRGQKDLPRTRFIDYNMPFDYYHGQRKKLKLQFKDEVREIELPYKEEINFIDNPDTTIAIDGPITDYTLPEAITNDTQEVFESYLEDHPHTTNGPTFRMADLQKVSDGKYIAKLQNSHYFDEVRTSLTLDFPLDHDFLTSRRLEDLGPNNQLKPLQESQMVCNMGVFSVLAFRSKGIWYFHMMPRAKKIGVFGGMLSSVGGTVEFPKEPITELVSYITSEIKREVREETGLDVDALARERNVQVVPLAFTRELSRGGHAQFFYLTVMDELSDKEFAEAFKHAEWSFEFRSDPFSNIKAVDDVISPEFSTALFYALTYLQQRRKLPTDVLRLR